MLFFWCGNKDIIQSRRRAWHDRYGLHIPEPITMSPLEGTRKRMCLKVGGTGKNFLSTWLRQQSGMAQLFMPIVWWATTIIYYWKHLKETCHRSCATLTARTRPISTLNAKGPVICFRGGSKRFCLRPMNTRQNFHAIFTWTQYVCHRRAESVGNREFWKCCISSLYLLIKALWNRFIFLIYYEFKL